MANKQIYQLTANPTPATSHMIPMQDSAGSVEAVRVSIAQLKTALALTKTDVGLASVDNTSDAAKNSAAVTLTNKTISGANNTLTGIPQSAVTTLVSDLATKAPLVSPALTGTPSAPTATAGTNTTQIATTAFVKSALDNATIYFSNTDFGGTGTLVDPIVNLAGGGSGISTGVKGDINVVGVNTDWEIVAGAVTATELAANAVITAKILDANVTLAKLAALSGSGKLLGSSASGTAISEILIGSGLTLTGSTLSATGGGGGGTETLLVDWTTVTAGADITASINTWYTTYKYIRIEFIDVAPLNATNLFIRVSQDNSTFLTSGYLSTYTKGAAYEAGPANAFQISDFTSNVAGEVSRGAIEIYNSGTTDKPSIMWNFNGFYTTASNNSPRLSGGGSINTAGAIRSVKLVMNSGTISGKYRIFGR